MDTFNKKGTDLKNIESWIYMVIWWVFEFSSTLINFTQMWNVGHVKFLNRAHRLWQSRRLQWSWSSHTSPTAREDPPKIPQDSVSPALNHNLQQRKKQITWLQRKEATIKILHKEVKTVKTESKGGGTQESGWNIWGTGSSLLIQWSKIQAEFLLEDRSSTSSQCWLWVKGS